MTRLVRLALALTLASAGLLPCLCVAAAAAAPVASHCGSAEPSGPGLHAGAHACDCTCMSAAATREGLPRIEPAFTGATFVAPPVPARSTATVAFLPPPAPDPPRAAPPPTLRI